MKQTQEMIKANLPLDEISNRVIDAVLNERYINRESLSKIIRPILKIWLKNTDGFRTRKASKDKLQWTVEARDIERKYWLNKFRELTGVENMQPFYDELDLIKEKEGYKDYESQNTNQ